jgi:hypothetical protein
MTDEGAGDGGTGDDARVLGQADPHVAIAQAVTVDDLGGQRGERRGDGSRARPNQAGQRPDGYYLRASWGRQRSAADPSDGGACASGPISTARQSYSR